MLQGLLETNPRLNGILTGLRDSDPRVRNLDLASYLLAPMQRLTRYPLLIKQIASHTQGDSEEARMMERALRLAEDVLERINETIRDREGHEILESVSKNLWIGNGRLDLTQPTRCMGPRRLLKEGVLTKGGGSGVRSRTKSGRKLWGCLCSDIFVVTDEERRVLYRLVSLFFSSSFLSLGKRD